jgi:hypothetical protein
MLIKIFSPLKIFIMIFNNKIKKKTNNINLHYSFRHPKIPNIIQKELY